MPHTRKEKLRIGQEIVERIFHKKPLKEVTIKGWVVKDLDDHITFGTQKPIVDCCIIKFPPCWKMMLPAHEEAELTDSCELGEPTSATITIKIEK